MNWKNELKGQVDKDTLMRVRDGILMMLYFTTDLQSVELARLTIQDVGEDCLHVRHRTGKRCVPVGCKPMHLLKEYIRHVRPHIGKSHNAEAPLFVSVYDAEPMTPNYLQKTIKYHLNRLNCAEPVNRLALQLSTFALPFHHLCTTFSVPFQSPKSQSSG